MNKTIIKIPGDVEFLSNWAKEEDGYHLDDYNFPHILNKSITGCGFTEYCITSNLNVILCSPRRILLENKENQHPGELLYARSKMPDDKDKVNSFDRDISDNAARPSTKLAKEITGDKEEESDPEYLKLCAEKSKEFREEVFNYAMAKLYSTGKEKHPCKILVTYDSFRQVKEALGNEIDKFYIVVDEFQSIMVDARFKSTTELEFVRELQGLKKVCYVSATPMLDNYISMLDELKDLPYYEFDWASENPLRVMNPIVSTTPIKSVVNTVEKIINTYKEGKFKRHIYRDSNNKVKEVLAKEAVFFVNSVRNICDIIRRCELTPENTNVLCADSNSNKEKIMRAFRLSKEERDAFKIGVVPRKGEPHKMFTFCTRTVYLGADFYSTCARSFVLSDSNIDCLSVDITMDLPQILGRQRLKENPWKNEIEMFFKSTLEINAYTREEFEEMLNRKVKNSDNLLEMYYSNSDESKKALLAEKYKNAIALENYKNDYVAIDRHAGNNIVPVFNRLVMISDMRSFEVQQIDFKDRVSVISAISNLNTVINMDSIELVNKKIETFISLPSFPEKLEFVCITADGLDEVAREYFLRQLPTTFRDYYLVFGSEKCKALRYRMLNLEQEYLRIVNNQDLNEKDIILKEFNIGESYSKKIIKEKLSKIYDEIGLIKSAKATDILNYFNVKETSIAIPNSTKRDHGYLLVSFND